MKKNGFVFIETLVVVSVLTLTLILLYSSYSYILTKTKENNTYDSIETLYKVHFVKKALGTNYASQITSKCKRLKTKTINSTTEGSAFNSYECDLLPTKFLLPAYYAYNVEKIYYVNVGDLFVSSTSNDFNKNKLLAFDATTIDYLVNIARNHRNKTILILKIKKMVDSSKNLYEIIHASDAEVI